MNNTRCTKRGNCLFRNGAIIKIEDIEIIAIIDSMKAFIHGFNPESDGLCSQKVRTWKAIARSNFADMVDLWKTSHLTPVRPYVSD